VRTTVELPSRLRLSLGGGLLPDAYLASIQRVATGAGWYSKELATVIDTALSRAFVIQPKLGWRPWEDRGYFFGVGYQRVIAVGGEAGAAEVAAGVDGVGGGTDYFLKSQLRMATIEAGHEWPVKDRLVVRASLGGAVTLGASTVAEEVADEEARLDRLRAAGRDVLEAYLNDTYTRYVHTPTVGIEVGWRFL